MALSPRSIAEPVRVRLAPLDAIKGDPESLLVHEIYASIQGESTFAGMPCVFVRTTACHLRCRYCDTEHSFHEGRVRNVDEVIEEVEGLGIPLVELTGGEPLLQKGAFTLVTRLCDRGVRVLVETSGGVSTRSLDPRAVCILDVKTPGSGEVDSNVWSNLDHVKPTDEVKFVLTSREDYEWMRDLIARTRLSERCTVLAGVAFGEIDNRDLVRWILQDRLGVRFQLQLHKHVWPPHERGV